MHCPSCNKDVQPTIQLNPGRGDARFLKVCPCGNVLSGGAQGGEAAVSVGTPGRWDKPGQEDAVWIPDPPKAAAAPAPAAPGPSAEPRRTPGEEAALEMMRLDAAATYGSTFPAATGENFIERARQRLAQIDAFLATVEPFRIEREEIARLLRAAERQPRSRRTNVVPMPKKAAQ